MHQPKRFSGSLQQGHQGSRQLIDYVSCVSDTHHSMQGTSPDQQPKAATSGNKQQLVTAWEEQHEPPHLCQAGESHWAPGPASMAGARSYCQAPSWESKVAAVWGKSSSTSQKATGIAAVEDGVADVPGLEQMDTSHWAAGHAVPAALVTGLPSSAVQDSHWAFRASPGREAATGSPGLNRQPDDDAANAPAAHGPVKTCNTAGKRASPSGADNTAEDSSRHRCADQHVALHQNAATQYHQHPGLADIRAAALGDRSVLCTGRSGESGSPAAAAPCSAVMQQGDATAPTAGDDSTAPMEAEHGLGAAGGGSMKRHLPVAYPPPLQAGADAGRWDPEAAMDAVHRHQDADDMLTAEMPNLKKLRTRVQGLRVDSADDRHRDSSPAAADNIGGIMPTYGSPRVEQTMRSYPDLDCGSAKAFNAGAAATKPSGLSRFAPAAGCPVSPTVPATGGCAVQSSKHQHQAIGAQDDSMAGLGGAAASRAESQSAEAPGSVDLPCDDQWMKHNEELQQLKQQQDALRALLHQAEQQVRDPLLQEAEYLTAEMQAKVGDSAAGQVAAGMQQTSDNSNKLTAESDAERVAAQLLAQEGGNWEKAMRRMLNLVQSTMQHGGSQGSTCSNPRMADLKRSSSTASPIHRAASLAASAAVNEGAADAVELGQAPAEAGNHSQVLKRDLSRQGSSHWGLQRQQGMQGSMSPYAAAAAQRTSPYQPGPGSAGHCSPYPAAGSTGGHNSPYASAAGAVGAAGPHSSPFIAGPVSAAKLAWPMVPASAVGSPVGSPACSPMVPTSAVGSPMAAAPDTTATVGGISSMILPSTGGGAAAGCSPAGTGVRYGSPVANQHCVEGEGCSRHGSPGAAAAAAAASGGRSSSRSPACTLGRPKAGLVRQPSRLAPKPPRASVASITGGFGCGAGLSISAGGPAAYNTDAEPAGLSISSDGPAAFSADVAAAAVAGLSVSAAGPSSYHMGAQAARMSVETMNVSAEVAPAQPANDERYATAYHSCAGGNVSSSTQHVEMEEAAADGMAAYAGDVGQAAIQVDKLQQQQLPITTTAAAAAAAFGKVPSVSVDQDLEDAAGWLFGESGLLPDTPGPVNLMNQQSKTVGQAQQQDQQQQQLRVVAAAGMGQSANMHQYAEQHQAVAASQHQAMVHAAMHTPAPMLESSGGWPAAVQGNDAGPETCHGRYSYMPHLAPVYQGLNTTAAAAVEAEAMAAAVPGAGGSCLDGSTPWQYIHSVQHQMLLPAGTASAVTAHEQYQQMQQQHSQEPQQDGPAAAAVATGAIADADDAAASRALGSDKDDLALLQVLLGWANDDA